MVKKLEDGSKRVHVILTEEQQAKISRLFPNTSRSEVLRVALNALITRAEAQLLARQSAAQQAEAKNE